MYIHIFRYKSIFFLKKIDKILDVHIPKNFYKNYNGKFQSLQIQFSENQKNEVLMNPVFSERKMKIKKSIISI